MLNSVNAKYLIPIVFCKLYVQMASNGIFNIRNNSFKKEIRLEQSCSLTDARS